MKSIIEYLGTTYIMPDGCPSPDCDPSQEECLRTRSTIRNLYGHCIQSEEGQHVGCVTDRMGDGSYLTGKAKWVEEFPTWAKNLHTIQLREY